MRSKAEHSPEDGGSAFAADPDRTAREQDVIWSPRIDPAHILLEQAPLHLDGPMLDDLQAGAQTIEVHGVTFAVTQLSVHGSGPLAAVILLDALTPDRLEALARFWATMFSPPAPPDRRLTRLKRRRAARLLRAVDGRVDGASYREIAQALFPTHRIPAAAWKGDAIRETTIRLVRNGIALVKGGYRALLQRSRKKRDR